MIRFIITLIIISPAIICCSFFKPVCAREFSSDGLADIIEKVSPAIVYIEEYDKQDKFTSPFEEAIEVPFIKEAKTTGHGSGFFISDDGYLLTSRHVIEEMSKIRIITYDKKLFIAHVEDIDTDNDYALLKIDAQKMPFLKLEFTRKIRAGNWAIAMGCPFKSEPIATFGIVSAIGTTQSDSSRYRKYIQTDASFAPGISGGPLLDIEGKVIGINSAMLAKGGAKYSMGLALAVSSIADSDIFKRYSDIFQ